MKIKGLKEQLCSAQSKADDWPSGVSAAVADLIRLIEVHRPIGPDGKHGNRHTATCGCEDK